MFTKKFYEIVGDRLNRFRAEDIQSARELSLDYLEKNHLVKSIEEEQLQFVRFYSDISRKLNLSLTKEEIHIISYDRTNNMNNYIIYPDVKEVLEALSKSYMLGIISDTWPGIEKQLDSIGVRDFFR